MRRPQIVLLCALLFCAGAAVAAERAPTDAEFLASLADDTGKTPVAAEASCSATSDPCPGYNAPAVSCSCSGASCDCDSGSDWVECNGVRKECPTPTPCSAFTPCPGGGSVSCNGTNNSCLGGSGLCFALCDGQATFCPGQFGAILCPF